MSFYVSEGIKDRISEEQITGETFQFSSAVAIGSSKVYRILKYAAHDKGCIVNIEVAGDDLFEMITNKNCIDYLIISANKIKIKDQTFNNFFAIDGSNEYNTEIYLRTT